MHRVIFYQLDYSIKLNASGKNINFDENRVNKSDFYKNKKLFNIDNIDVNKILIPKKEPCSKKKYFHLNNLFDVMIMMILDHCV